MTLSPCLPTEVPSLCFQMPYLFSEFPRYSLMPGTKLFSVFYSCLLISLLGCLASPRGVHGQGVVLSPESPPASLGCQSCVTLYLKEGAMAFLGVHTTCCQLGSQGAWKPHQVGHENRLSHEFNHGISLPLSLTRAHTHIHAHTLPHTLLFRHRTHLFL